MSYYDVMIASRPDKRPISRSRRRPEGPADSEVWTVGVDREHNEQLGTLLRRMRNSSGSSAAALSAQLGLSPSFVRMVERGERSPAPPTAADWLKTLGASVEQDVAIAGGMRADMVITHPDLAGPLILQFKSRVRDTSRSDIETQFKAFIDRALEDRAPTARSPRADFAWPTPAVAAAVGAALGPRPDRFTRVGEAVSLLSNAPDKVVDAVLATLRSHVAPDDEHNE